MSTQITQVLARGAWIAEPIDQVELDYDGRHRRRIVLIGASGAKYLLDLPKAMHLRDGDGLKVGDAVVMVVAKPEPLLEIRAANPEALIRLAWHIGNRHLAAQLDAQRILLRRDHVIAHMLEHLGATVLDVDEPFDPEGGAYEGQDVENHHGHDH
jgi:urease accessory protein